MAVGCFLLHWLWGLVVDLGVRRVAGVVHACIVCFACKSRRTWIDGLDTEAGKGRPLGGQ
jgi:hypothetical protein